MVTNEAIGAGLGIPKVCLPVCIHLQAHLPGPNQGLGRQRKEHIETQQGLSGIVARVRDPDSMGVATDSRHLPNHVRKVPRLIIDRRPAAYALGRTGT